MGNKVQTIKPNDNAIGILWFISSSSSLPLKKSEKNVCKHASMECIFLYSTKNNKRTLFFAALLAVENLFYVFLPSAIRQLFIS